MQKSDDELRDIARKAVASGMYSGSVKALRAVYLQGQADVWKALKDAGVMSVEVKVDGHNE